MTELLEPAPMFGDGDDYGGPIKTSDINNQFDIDIHHDEHDKDNHINNDNAESDIEINLKDSDSDNDAKSESPSMSHNRIQINNDDISPKPKHIDQYDKKHEEEPISANSTEFDSNSNKELMAHHHKLQNRASNNDEHRATSAGILFGENEERHRIGTESEQIDNGLIKHEQENKNRRNKKENIYRMGKRGCFGDLYCRLYSYPRLRIFLSFLYLLVSLILVCGDIFGALWIMNELWSFKYPNANTNFHELWFGILMVLICAPFLILWAAHLIFIEETISKQNEDKKCFNYLIKYPFIILYIITPFGIIFLLIYELIYIYLWAMINLLFYRFLCRKPSYKMIMNIKKTKGSRAYLRFRKISHMFSFSIPLMVFYGYLYYFDPYPRLKWKYLASTVFISGLNSIFTILSFLNDAKSINMTLSQYFILSLRLFGGYIPKLNMIKKGEIRRINYSSFAFGNYTYSQFADVIESETSKLETVILTASTLRDLSKSLCYQLGAVCTAKQINIIILKNYSSYVVWFKHLFPKRFVYRVTLVELKQALRNCPIFGDKAEEEFDQIEYDLDKLYDINNNDKYYYYYDFVNDWNGFQEENSYNRYGNDCSLGMFHRLLRILPPHIVDCNNKHTKDNELDRNRDERLLNLVLGTGKINQIDPTNKTSALFYAIIQMDYDLINRLCDNGAKTSKDEWIKLGEYIIQLVKDNNINALQQLIKLIKERDEIECDLTYSNIDGKTAVMYSAINGNQKICQLLLSCNLGADILYVDQDGNTAADLAMQHKHFQLEQYLRNQFL